MDFSILETEFDMDEIEKDEDLQNELRMLGWSDDAPVSRLPPKKIPKPNGPTNQTPAVPTANKTKNAGISATKISEDHFSGFEGVDVEEVDESNIEFTEEDMMDPELLRQLRELDGDDGENRENEGDSRDSRGSDNEYNQINGKTIGTETTITSTIVSNSISDMDKPLISFDQISIEENTDTEKLDAITADEARDRALACGKERNKTEAMKWMRIAKMKDLEASKPAEIKVAPQKQAPTVKAAIDAKSSVARDDSSKALLVRQVSRVLAVPGKVDRFTHLEVALNTAMKDSLKDAQVLMATDKKAAAKKMNDYKRYKDDLSVLESRRYLSGAEPAPFVWKSVERQTTVERLDIADDQLVLHIDGITDLENSLTGYSSRNIQITYDLGVPRDEPATGKITGKVDAHGSVILNFQRVLPIIKRNRALQTLVSKKKATFEVALLRGMFLSNIVLGHASLALSDLVFKCEAGGILPLEKVVSSSSTGKTKSASTAGSVTAYLRVRKPVVGAEIIKTVERTLVLEDWPPVNHSPEKASMQSVATKPSKVPVSEAKQVAATSPKKPAVTVPNAPQNIPHTVPQSAAHGAAKSVPQNAQNGVELSEREKADPCAVDLLVSNDVLEAEIAADNAAISVIEKKGAGSRSEEDENDLFNLKIRVQLMTTKLGLLVGAVQDEKLSFEEYLGMVKDRINRDRMLLKWVRSAASQNDPPIGSKENIAAVARRLDIMVRELKSAEESMG